MKEFAEAFMWYVALTCLQVVLFPLGLIGVAMMVVPIIWVRSKLRGKK